MDHTNIQVLPKFPESPGLDEDPAGLYFTYENLNIMQGESSGLF